MKIGDIVLLEARVESLSGGHVTVSVPMRRLGGGSTPLPVDVDPVCVRAVMEYTNDGAIMTYEFRE